MNKKNTETYTDIYGIFPGKQDNASPHSALQPHHCRRNVLDWLACSPGLFLIGKVWCSPRSVSWISLETFFFLIKINSVWGWGDSALMVLHCIDLLSWLLKYEKKHVFFFSIFGMYKQGLQWIYNYGYSSNL